MTASLPVRIRDIEAAPLDCRLGQTFAISSASQDEVTSVLVRVVMTDGSTGYGEAAPMRPFNEQTQSQNLAAVRSLKGWIEGKEPWAGRGLGEGLKERLAGNAPVRAAVEMAIDDAASRHCERPLWKYLLVEDFSRPDLKLKTDYTISVGSVEDAARDAKKIFARGIHRIKMKVGKDPDIDVERVLAVRDAGRIEQLILDANQAYDAKRTLAIVKDLERHGIVPDLLEQPVPREDWDGLAEVSRGTKVPVCADEAVRTVEEAERMVKVRAASVVNIKLMKSGLWDAFRIGYVCRKGGLGLMIGGMVETRLAMTAAAHLAASIGGFAFVDLDTPYFLARDPMKGPGLDAHGNYDLSPIKAGIGIVPRDPGMPPRRRLYKHPHKWEFPPAQR